MTRRIRPVPRRLRRRPLPPGRWIATLAAVLMLFPLAAGAHDFWIQPADFSPPVGHPVAVELRVGVGFPGGQVARRDAHTERFALLGPSGEAALPGVDGAAPAGIFRPEASGDHVLVYRGDDSAITLEAEEFEAYLAEEGLEHVSELRAHAGDTDAPGREVYSRSVKALVVARAAAMVRGDADRADTDRAADPSAVAGREAATAPSLHTRPAGLALELVPEIRPAGLAAGDELALRLLLRGEPLAGALVRSEPSPEAAAAGGEPAARRSDADGRVAFRLGAPGVWKIATVHMEPVGAQTAADEEGAAAEGTPAADWRSIWTTLTFELGAAAPTAPRGAGSAS